MALLLSFTPDMPSALSATPQQALLFLLAVFMADRAVRRRRGGSALRLQPTHMCAAAGGATRALSRRGAPADALHARRQPRARGAHPIRSTSPCLGLLVGAHAPRACQALLRAEVEHAVWAEVADAASGAALPPGCREAALATVRARRYLGALAAAAPLELFGAVLAALAPHPAPGIAAVFAAQARARVCAVRGARARVG